MSSNIYMKKILFWQQIRKPFTDSNCQQNAESNSSILYETGEWQIDHNEKDGRCTRVRRLIDKPKKTDVFWKPIYSIDVAFSKNTENRI